MHMLSDRAAVLYVEDDTFNAMLMQALFGLRPDLQLHVVSTCAEARRCAAALQPSLLLLDLQLPDGHGLRLLQWLRTLPTFLGVPAVAVTSDHPATAKTNGFDEVWPKPLDVGLVLQRLLHWLPQAPACTAPTPAHAPAMHPPRSSA